MTAKLDASAIIYLGKANLLDLVAQVCSGLVITTGVYEEVVVRGREAGHRDADAIEEAVQNRVVRVTLLEKTGRKRLEEAGFPARLGIGEQETIVEALEQACLAVLDDGQARAAAVVLGTTLCRTETLLVEALVRNLIGLVEFEAALLRLARVRGMRPDDLAELLRLGRLIGEVLADDCANTRSEESEG